MIEYSTKVVVTKISPTRKTEIVTLFVSEDGKETEIFTMDAELSSAFQYWRDQNDNRKRITDEVKNEAFQAYCHTMVMAYSLAFRDATEQLKKPA
jgi:hypothetical protein